MNPVSLALVLAIIAIIVAMLLVKLSSQPKQRARGGVRPTAAFAALLLLLCGQWAAIAEMPTRVIVPVPGTFTNSNSYQDMRLISAHIFGCNQTNGAITAKHLAALSNGVVNVVRTNTLISAAQLVGSGYTHRETNTVWIIRGDTIPLTLSQGSVTNATAATNGFAELTFGVP